MKELFARLAARPGLTAEMIAASLLANVLALATPLFVIQVLNRYIAQGVDATLATLTAGVAVAIVLEFGFRQIRMRLAANVNASYDRALAGGAFNSLINTKAAALEQVSPGIRQEMIAGAEKMQAAYNASNICTVLDVPFALLFVGALFLLNPTIATIVSAFLAFTFVVSLIALAALRRLSRELQRSAGKRSGLVGSTAAAGDAIRAFNAGDFIRRQWLDETGKFQHLCRKITQRQGFVQSLSMSLQAYMGVTVIATGATLVVAGELDVGGMIGANILAARALGPFIKFAALNEPLAKANQALATFQDFARLPRERGEGTAVSEYNGRIELQDIAFSYFGAKTPLFESVNLTLEPGSVLMFAGANGTGKTTMARLFLGLLEPTRGKFLIDGVDLAQVSPEWWRKQVIYLPQEPNFLNASVSDNLSTANPDITEAELNELIDKAWLRTFIDRSSDGIKTQITNNGANLSLGIRRRLALARALATDGTVMLVDEPTEGLDNEGAQAVIAAMTDHSKRGRTVIAFSHDPNILEAAPHFVDLNVKPVPTLVRKRLAASSSELASATEIPVRKVQT